MSRLHRISTNRTDDRAADIVFIHGLGGDAFKTWRSGPDESSSWPHWMAEEFPDLGVWSLDYAANPTKRFSFLQKLKMGFSADSRNIGHAMSLPDRGRQVVDDMVNRGFGDRPLVLICHSLGGLLAKQILRTSADALDQEWRKIFENTRAVLFLATPHQGASIASLADTFRKTVGTTPIMEDLRAHDPNLQDLANWYKNHSRKIRTRAYFETKDTHGVRIVNSSSANPGVGDDPIGLDEDHLTIVKPLSREAQVCDAARKLIRLVLSESQQAETEEGKAQTKKIENSPVPAPHQAGSRSSRKLEIYERPTLTIILKRSQDRIDRTWQYFDGAESAGAAAFDGLLQGTSEELGTRLFEILFGEEMRWRPLLRKLFRRPDDAVQPMPTYGAVRVRILTTDPDLLRLPWQLARWRGQWLAAHWTFEVTEVPKPDRDRSTAAQSAVLALGVAGSEEDVLKEVLREIWPNEDLGWWRRVVDRSRLADAFRGVRPHLLIVEDRIGIADLADVLRSLEHYPEVVALRGVAEPRELRALQEIADLVVHWPDADARPMLTWLKRWLKETEDPIRALFPKKHASAEPETLRRFRVYSRYRSWKTTGLKSSLPSFDTRLHLDRVKQKAFCEHEIREFSQNPGLRVLSLVTYAPPQNAVADFAEQLQASLEANLSAEVEMDWEHLDMPPSRDHLREDLERDLPAQLDAHDGEHIAHLLQRKAPSVGKPGKRPILCLNWGTCGAAHQKPLKPSQLQAWLRFTRDYLSLKCPETLQVICFLTIEAQNHERLVVALDEVHRESLHGETFRLPELDPLGPVPPRELYDFLAQKTDCPKGICAETAQRLGKKTGGVFEELVTVIDSRTNWYDLLSELQKEQEPSKFKDDEPIV